MDYRYDEERGERLDQLMQEATDAILVLCMFRSLMRCEEQRLILEFFK